jgi:hypothetical protein
MKPRLLPDIQFIPTDSGLSVRAPGHEASLHAPGLYPWFERVCPFLDGDHSVVDLVEKLSPPAAQRVLGLVEFLLREGFARDAEYDLPHTLSPATRALHGGMIEYLAHLADSPERRFQSYRECAPVAVGSGRLLAATALALLATGVARVRVHVLADGADGEGRTDRASLLESAAPLLHRDPEARLEFADGEPADVPADAGALLYAADRPVAAQAARLRSLATRRGLRYGAAYPDGDRVVVSEVTLRVPAAAGAAGARAAFAAVGDVPGAGCAGAGRYFGGPAAALAGNQLCRNLLQHAAGLTELEAEPEAGPMILDLPAATFRPR